MFNRRNVSFVSSTKQSTTQDQKTQSAQLQVSEREFRVLVINSSSDMAKEITLQLTLGIPGCLIMYAPSLELARLILARRAIDLVVSSPVLPDGGLARLKGILEGLGRSPDVAIVGDALPDQLEHFRSGNYEVSHVRHAAAPKNQDGSRVLSLSGKSLRLASKAQEAPMPPPALSSETISSLGADLRNDLNNPLQEIVAMLFVAKTGNGSTQGPTAQALDAIDRAAKNMATVVKGLETRIRNAANNVDSNTPRPRP